MVFIHVCGIPGCPTAVRYGKTQMKVLSSAFDYRFPFEKYVHLILSVIPKNDLVGISEIRFVSNFSHPKADKSCPYV